MPNLNHVHLIGHLTRDPELKFLQNDTAVCEFGLAVTDRVKRNGEWQDKPMFIEVTYFGKIAEVCNEFLHKGSPCMVFGRLDFQQWEKDGVKRSKHVVIGDKMQMLGTKGGNRSESQEGRTVDEYSQDGPPASAPARDDEECPFSLLWLAFPFFLMSMGVA